MYTVNTAGYNARHPHNFFMSRPNGNPDYLILNVKSPSLFLIDGVELIVNPGSAVLVLPHIPYQYQSIEGDYKNDWRNYSEPPIRR